MYNFPIGVLVECFRKDLRSAILTASQLGLDGIQMFVAGDNAPDKMNASARRELLDFVKSNGLKFSALCGDMGCGFANPENNPIAIEKSKRMLDMSLDLECGIVTTHIGVVPEDKNVDRYKIMQEACYELAEYADSVGAHFAIETGPERSSVLKGFLDSLGSRGVGVNLDPANLRMVIGEDPAEAVYNLKDYIVHTHAKDGNMLHYMGPEIVYGIVHPVPQEFHGIVPYEEVPLGTGSVNFPSYLKALEDIGYRGFLTIEREVGQNPEADIITARDFLKRTIENN